MTREGPPSGGPDRSIRKKNVPSGSDPSGLHYGRNGDVLISCLAAQTYKGMVLPGGLFRNQNWSRRKNIKFWRFEALCPHLKPAGPPAPAVRPQNPSTAGDAADPARPRRIVGSHVNLPCYESVQFQLGFGQSGASGQRQCERASAQQKPWLRYKMIAKRYTNKAERKNLAQ